VKYLSGAPLRGRLLAYPASIGPGVERLYRDKSSSLSVACTINMIAIVIND